MSTVVAPKFTLRQEGERTVLAVSGDWIVSEIGAVDADLRSLSHASMALDVSELGKLDTAGAFILDRTLRAGKAGAADQLSLIGDHPTAEELILRVSEASGRVAPKTHERAGFVEILAGIGSHAKHLSEVAIGTLSFFGETLVTCARLIANPRRMRWTSMFSVMERAGFDAIPIVAFLSFFIGIVLAYMGAFTLSAYGGGAEVFAVELVGVSVMREFGVLLTGIILAGRTNSAFTAQIGAMRMRQEVDAMQTLGLSPMEVLVAPRIFALVIMTPILTFIAVIAGLFGGMMTCWIGMDINPTVFLQRTQDYVPLQNFWVGMSKAPLFGLVVALIGCRQGLEVTGSVQSLGSRTTTSVVEALFSIIVIDAIFAIFYMEMGI